MVNLSDLFDKPRWHEVWPAGWGFYRVYICDDGYRGMLPGRYVRTTVFGQRRAIARAEAMQKALDAPPPVPVPVFTTRKPEEDTDG